MITEQIAEVLTGQGFRRLKGNVSGISMNYKVLEGEAFVVIHCFLPNGTEFLPEQLLNIRKQARVFFENSGISHTNALFVLYTENAAVLKPCGEVLEGCWIADLTENRLIIYENQAADFAGVRSLLERFLAGEELQRREETAEEQEAASGYAADPRAGAAQSHRTMQAGQTLRNRGTGSAGIGRYVCPCNIIIIAACVLVFLIQDLFFSGEQVMNFVDDFGLFWPSVFEEGEYYRVFTYMFLHSGFDHLANNMIVLLFIGNNVERIIGKWKYLVIYFSSGIIAGIVSIVYNMYQGQYVLSIGASGAGFGIIGAFACLLLLNRGRLANMSLPRILLFVGLSLYGGFTSQGIDNAAHVGGLLAGIVITALLWILRRRVHED